MAASVAAGPFDSKDWLFEIKQDGFRIVGYVQPDFVTLQTRKLVNYTNKFPSITTDLLKWNHSAILDGEVVVLNSDGISDFEALINWKIGSGVPVYYYVFDLLWLDGKDYMSVPLYKRKEALKQLLPRSRIVRYQSDIRTHGIAAFNMAKENHLEGIIAKRRESIYRPGIRSKDWLKVKAYKEDEFLIAGYTRNQGAGLISTLILGAYKNKRLQFAGEVGTGLSAQVMEEIIRRVLQVPKCPFKKEPKLTTRWRRNKPDIIVWCRPVLSCTVKYLEMTKGGELRHASFKNLVS
ncbi:non-homologous end-joining DNA ligase [Longitalea arenae]|uniref:non-homologous end-joining DNA ligase n=1 Tax=Longitalea arenae TaxID=2812558 RepID=UPI001966F7C0|nr:non-homologous end-joining DNA ligase [Longitalea arenae]